MSLYRLIGVVLMYEMPPVSPPVRLVSRGGGGGGGGGVPDDPPPQPARVKVVIDARQKKNLVVRKRLGLNCICESPHTQKKRILGDNTTIHGNSNQKLELNYYFDICTIGIGAF
jgi:hypothetical protein